MQTQQQKQKVEQTFQPQQAILPQSPQQYINPENLSESKVHSVISHSSNPQNLLKFFQEYQPNNKYMVMKDLHNSAYIKLKKYKQSVYYGDFINVKRHGKGIMIYDDGRVYQGQWECDYKHGKGWEKFGNNSTYSGDYVNGKPQGVGKYSWPNGEFYEGEWINGMKHGSGMWRGAKGDSYIGEWKHGKADGYGVHTWVNGDRYEGEFKECLKHGQGIQKFSNGDMYKGFYQNGKPSGFGQYYWANGSYFKGKFQNGLRNGEGIWKRKTGNSDKYEGSYQNDKKSGYGIFTWATGNIYKGNYQADVRSGYGEMYWSDGSYYRGQWKNGIQNGDGELYVPGQGLKKGIFQDNILVIIQKQSQLIMTDPNDALSQNKILYPSYQQKLPRSKISAIMQQKQMPQKIKHFRSRDYKLNKSKQHKSIDDNIVVRYNPTTGISKQPIFNSSYNHNHPLLPKKHYSVGRQQKYLTIDSSTKYKNMKGVPRNSIYKTKTKTNNNNNNNNNRRETYQRILHSSFYMHQLHNRATTSINGSRAEVQSGYSGFSGSVEYGGRRARRDLDTRAIQEMRYYNRTRVGKESKTPGI